MTVLIPLILALQADPLNIDRLLVQLGDDSIEVRSQAEESIIRRSRSWSKEEVEALRKGVEDPVAERAIRVRRALGWVEWFRDIPDELWKAVPDLGKRLRSNNGGGVCGTPGEHQHGKAKRPPPGLDPPCLRVVFGPRGIERTPRE